ncbi:MAG: hypothetical protein ACP5GS_08470 [Nitrososphaeria archaeon]
MRQFRHKRYLIRIVEYGWSPLEKGAKYGRTILSKSITEDELSELLPKLTLLLSKGEDEDDHKGAKAKNM